MDEERAESSDSDPGGVDGEGEEMEAINLSDAGEDGDGGDGGEDEAEKVYLPGQPLEEGEELVHDSSAYSMYHVAQTGAPCLSFDVLRDSLGDGRIEFPLTAYLVAGTQAEAAKQNFIVLIKMSELRKTSDGNDSDSEDETLDDDEPQLDTLLVQHTGAINRIRVAKKVERTLVASWSEKGVVHIWDTSKHAILLDSPSVGGASAKSLTGHKEKPLFSFSGHQCEGYAMDWSPTVPGRLVTGACNSNIHLWAPGQDGQWLVEQRPFSAHTASVEDIQWSPNEESVFASCSVDQTVRVWDCRAAPSKACMLTTHAHEADVNVISWNSREPFIVSGGDDGMLKVWDLRQLKKGSAAAMFKHHSAAVTSVEWSPNDSTVFASAGEDDQVVQWDLAVEHDDGSGQRVGGIPPQLLFIHQGQKEVKELHWHPQLPGVMVTTAISGFNIFKTISV